MGGIHFVNKILYLRPSAGQCIELALFCLLSPMGIVDSAIRMQVYVSGGILSEYSV